MKKFTHIDAFYQIVDYVRKLNKSESSNKILEPVKFIGTTKLHGTNCGITHDAKFNTLTFQSRSREITVEDDNAGFAKFATDNFDTIIEIFKKLRHEYSIEKNIFVTIYGEWIGKKIQKGVAINNLPNRQWVMFFARCHNESVDEYFRVLPTYNSYEKNNIFSIFDGPIWNLEIDFLDEKSLKNAVVKFETLTKKVEKECPWAKKFGISGVGEGIVWIPTEYQWGNSNLFFKTKGEKHKMISSKKESINPEILSSTKEFVTFSLTENRMNQGLEYLKESGSEIDIKNIGKYLKWIAEDIKRECNLDLEGSNLEWKQVAKSINSVAKNFYLNKIKKI